MSVDLTKIKNIYFIGIKGVAMSGLAVICKQRGMDVTGSDVAEKFITDIILQKHRIDFFETFSEKNLVAFSPDVVVVGTSWYETNPEVAWVKLHNLPMLTDSEFRGLLSAEKRTIAITGVHGKTTTTALLAHLFTRAGRNPSYLIGTGSVPNLGSNAAWSSGEHFIVEGDEYIGDRKRHWPKFLDLTPAVSLVTSIEWEHVDIYPTLDSLEQVFGALMKKTTDVVVACSDWPSVSKLIDRHDKKVVTYGFEQPAQYQASDVMAHFGHTTFQVKKDGTFFGEFKIKLHGRHNVLNALAAAIIALYEGISLDQIREGLLTFQGSQRRFDVSQRQGITFVDDYAHHPTEVRLTLAAVRHRYPDKKIWCVFQPHMVSRTKALASDFARSFADVDTVLFADIFASARENAQDYTSRDLTEVTKKLHPGVVYAGDLNETISYLKDKLQAGMVLVTMGAGDVYRVRDKLLVI